MRNSRAKRKGRRDLCRRPSLAAAGSRSPVLLQFHALSSGRYV